MKTIYILFILLLSNLLLYSQQTPLLSQYTYDKYLINPAFAGTSNIFNVGLNIRQQFVGFDGAPNTEHLSIHRPLQAQAMGIGLKLNSDKHGATNTFNALIGYAYRVGLGDSRLSFGLEGGVFGFRTDYASLVVADTEYDVAIPYDLGQILYPDASFGILFQIENFYLSYSNHHLIKGKTKHDNNENSTYNFLNRHHYFLTGYEIDINKEFNIEPFFLLKTTTSTPSQFDMAVRFNFKRLLSVGMLYRTGDALSFMFNLGIKDGTYRIGYSYDHNISQLSGYSRGGHEIMLIYNLHLMPPAGLREVNPIIYIK